MKAYLCTYRQRTPLLGELNAMSGASKGDDLLAKFLKEYQSSFYDWGDDPSFFAAKHMLHDVRSATWGVCRRDVRKELAEGDIVVFFCARQVKQKSEWHYYFIGYGTVLEPVRRKDVWTKPRYAQFRSFYNVLANSQGRQDETFHPYHKDWERRAASPYIIFDPKRSVFNLDSPRRVAKWRKQDRQEIWETDVVTKKIERLLFTERGIMDRRLRTSQTRYAHAKLNLLWDGKRERPGRPVPELIEALGKLVFKL
ncbi:MAG: hypothetical protein ACRD3N_11595 [Terracidiphilus sp.]